MQARKAEGRLCRVGQALCLRLASAWPTQQLLLELLVFLCLMMLWIKFLGIALCCSMGFFGSLH